MKAADPPLGSESKSETVHHSANGKMIQDGGEDVWKPYGFAALTVGLGIAYSYLKT